LTIGDHIYWSDLGYDISSKILKLKTSGTGVSADVVFIGVYKGVYDLKATTTKDGKGLVAHLVLNILRVNHHILEAR